MSSTACLKLCRGVGSRQRSSTFIDIGLKISIRVSCSFPNNSMNCNYAHIVKAKKRKEKKRKEKKKMVTILSFYKTVKGYSYT